MCRYNCDNGGPAPEKLTSAIFANTEKIDHYYIADEELKVDLHKIGTTSYLVQHADTKKFGDFVVQVHIDTAKG